MGRKYSVYDRRTDMPVLIHGTAAECAACMGIDTNSFYHSLKRSQAGRSKTKYEIFIDEDQDDLAEEE